MAQLWAFKLFDENGAALTVQQILNEADALKHEFLHRTSTEVEAIIKIARNNIATPEATMRRKRIRDKRNNLIAHLNRRVVTDPSNFASGLVVRWKDLLSEFDLAASILDDLCLASYGGRPSYEVPGSEDYENVISLIGQTLDK